MQVAILGRQPRLSLAELECLFGSETIRNISDIAALVQVESPLPQRQLGGTIKSARVLAQLDNTDLAGAFMYLRENIVEHLQYLPEGKLQFGVSAYGYKAQKNWLLKQMLELKKRIKKSGRSVRIIENKSEALETAQVLYNKLTGPLGWELLLIKDGSNTLLAQTTAAQDIDAYAARDHGRPKRDAFVGMLPPKLAQIMINLGAPVQDATILDPFCGTGVVLQEALLMGHPAYGTDISEKMIRFSHENLTWLQSTHSSLKKWYVEQADATTHTWKDHFETVVCETYLGAPLTDLPDPAKLSLITGEANHIATQFLQNLNPQLTAGTRLCIALPAWHLGNNQFKHLKVLDHLGELGYNRLDLVHANRSDLIYFRENQVVARELTILEKK